ncbi:DNA-processing protein DprA [Anatilimnocola floriformis]|uniref:DNA-processing protein DprA n=1 Tax=Anatilimnocola floriformis TaxID=2948575 RepID=UPI0020C3C547|nr:DNA-processing protein DprA [Anatilimnocola floriformis]
MTELSSDPARIAAVRLALVSGVGPIIRQALLERFQSAAAVLSAPEKELREVKGVGAKLAAAIQAATREVNAEEELAHCTAEGIAVLLESDEQYPQRLRDIHDPPGVLFLKGALATADELAIAIVGTRHATSYGLQQAERLAGGLARAGYTVVSGLARGIDAAAHRGALAAGGRTLAVLGSGLSEIYPPEHAGLAKEIATSGAVLGEQPPRMPPIGGAFPQRNRIISGLSLGTIVVEADKTSGALITARMANEQGREVFAVPGRVDNRMAHGCHHLIRDGAKLIESVDDVLEELGPLASPAKSDDGREIRHPVELQLNPQEQAVLAAIGDEPSLIDDVIVSSCLPVPRVLSTLSVLEMKRLVRRVSGNRVQRYH